MAKKSKKENQVQSKEAKRNIFQKIAVFFVNIWKKLKYFFSGLKAELKRVVWPDRKRLVQSTATVLAICLLVGLLLFVVDTLLGAILNAVGFYAPKPTPTPAPTTQVTTTVETTIETSEILTTASTE